MAAFGTEMPKQLEGLLTVQDVLLLSFICHVTGGQPRCLVSVHALQLKFFPAMSTGWRCYGTHLNPHSSAI